ncbi:hypothetical protein GCM10010430_30090 [Kitasatospora cystarginea]|uniref:Uncharacterized protein n=1 Tax=Kitasatospora cystarginea TaxID=58350 RepID=A0ABN3E0X9_9ACTN
MRVIGAITMRLGTVRPFSATGRDRIPAAREAEDAVTVIGVPRSCQTVSAHALNTCRCQPLLRPRHFTRPASRRVIPDTCPVGGEAEVQLTSAAGLGIHPDCTEGARGAFMAAGGGGWSALDGDEWDRNPGLASAVA